MLKFYMIMKGFGLGSRSCHKSDRPSADLRYGGKGSVGPSTLVSAAIKSKLITYAVHIPPDVPKKLVWR